MSALTTLAPPAAHTPNVASWVTSLWDLTASSFDKPAGFEERCATIAYMLAKDFPASAFTLGSARAVAAECGSGFPAYAAIRKHLAAWGKARAERHERESRRATGDQGPPPEWLAERILSGCSWSPGPMLAGWLIGKGINPHARPAIERDDAWGNPANVRATIAAITGHRDERTLARFLHTALERHAPDLLGMLPPHWLPAIETDTARAA